MASGPPFTSTPIWQRLVALMVLGHFCLAVAMAASPDLHEHFHHDAGHPDHQCAVTQMDEGDLSDGLPVEPLLIGPLPVSWVQVITVAFTPRWVPTVFSRYSILVHAPPAAWAP